MEFVETPCFWCPHVDRVACTNFSTRTVEHRPSERREILPFSFSISFPFLFFLFSFPFFFSFLLLRILFVHFLFLFGSFFFCFLCFLSFLLFLSFPLTQRILFFLFFYFIFLISFFSFSLLLFFFSLLGAYLTSWSRKEALSSCHMCGVQFSSLFPYFFISFLLHHPLCS